jgi:hypothetical protein
LPVYEYPGSMMTLSRLQPGNALFRRWSSGIYRNAVMQPENEGRAAGNPP